MTTRNETAAAHELSLTRTFDAPRELVFRMWTEPEHLVKWWGPAGFTAPTATMDVVEGGSWRACMVNGADGREYWSRGVYLEVVPPERLVFSFAWEEPVGQPMEDTLVTVTFAEHDGRTEMTFQQSAFDTEAARDDHRDGWRECFDDLARYVATQHGGPAR